MLRKKRVLAAAIETTPGTAASLGAAQAAMNVYDAEIKPSIDTLEVMAQGAFSQRPSVAGPRSGVATFKTYLEGDGAGGVPLWASTFLPAVGMVDTTGTFSPVTADVGTSVKNVTIATYEDGVRKMITGAAGNLKITWPAGGLIMFEWTFTGLWQPPTDQTILAPTYPTVRQFRWASGTYTLGAAAIGATETLTIDLGNEVTLKPTGTTASGYSNAVITNRKVNGSMDSESRLVATEDVFGEWLSGTEQALAVEVANTEDTITFGAPKVQRNDVQPGDRGGIQTDAVNFQCNRSAAAGDDEFTIQFAAT